MKLRHVLYIFALSMVPIIELRGAIPLGAGLDLPWWLTFLVCTVGNMVPVPFILLFIRAILKWMKRVKHLDRIALWVEGKAHKHAHKVTRYATWGLVLFVGVPLPGTGAWTGALIAAMLDMRMKYALPSILLGVLIAGFLVTGISYGFLSALDFML